jgi:Zn-finger nucleic acid-binding protein
VTESVACPSCGAPVDSGARHCAYCGAPVATVRCAGCFQLSSPDAEYCASCGRPLGLEPIGLSDSLSCPRCPGKLGAFGGNPGRLFDCPACGGQFVEHALFRELLLRREICGAAVPRRPLQRSTPGEPVRYVPCPSCHALMNRKNFGGISGVIVDICSKHGVWFDTGELPRVLEFVESGGLARAQQRIAEDLERKARGQALDQASSPVLLAHAESPPWATGLWGDATEAVHALLHGLGEWLEKR